MRQFLYITFIAIISFSCKKQNADEIIEKDFVKGDVLVGIDSSIQLEQLFTYVNPFNLYIDQLTGYVFTTTIPKDSILYIKAVLNSKPYINTRYFSASVWAHYQTDIVHNTTILWDMTLSNQTDYIQTKNSLSMTDKQSSTKNMLIKVPIGQEIYWKDKFKSFFWVRWTDLNWIGGIELHGR